eukprot:Gb_22443 [translate_table: standard]
MWESKRVYIKHDAVSGISGSKETAQQQVVIGMGLLAGSTVMLLTALWGSCLVVGKCDLSGEMVAIDSQDTRGFSLYGRFEQNLANNILAERVLRSFHAREIVRAEGSPLTEFLCLGYCHILLVGCEFCMKTGINKRYHLKSYTRL